VVDQKATRITICVQKIQLDGAKVEHIDHHKSLVAAEASQVRLYAASTII
jgi:hypothetical protein